jgi:hypothetical protein
VFHPYYSDDLDARLRHIERSLADLDASTSDLTTAAGQSDFSEFSGFGVSTSSGSGVLPMEGDVIGSSMENEIDKLQGIPINITSLTNGNFLVTSGTEWANQNYTEGKLGVGVNSAPTHRFELEDSDYTGWFTGSASNLKSGSRGLHLNKDKTRALPNAISFHTDGWPNWEIGMDFDTNNALSSGFGNADFVMAFDHSANANAGADVIRISPEEASSSSPSCKINIGRAVGTPASNAAFLTLDGGDDATPLAGLTVRYYGTNAGAGLALIQRNTANNRAVMSFGDTTETFWTTGSDASAANDKNFYFFDNVNNKTRLFIRNNSAGMASVGFGTTSPVAAVSVLSDTAADNTVHRGYHQGYANTAENRSINIEQIRQTGVAIWNYFWLNGGLGAGSTVGTRVTTSSFTQAWGLESGDAAFAVVSSLAAGTNQTIVRPLRFDISGGAYRIGFFDVTPQARPSAYTQTYSTADRTMANLTAAALTHGVGTADGTVDDVTGAFDQTILNNNFKELTTQVAALLADITDVKQALNSVIDDLQGYGLAQ